jgi:hypothetical protein
MPASKTGLPFTWGRINGGTWPSRLGEYKKEEKEYFHESRGTELKSTDPTSRQRGRPTSTNPKLSKNNQRENGKNWSRIPDGCLTPGRTGRLTVVRNIIVT